MRARGEATAVFSGYVDFDAARLGFAIAGHNAFVAT
jgi:hypothetical protein